MTRTVKQPKYKPRPTSVAAKHRKQHRKKKIQKFFPLRIENVASGAEYLECNLDLEAVNQKLMGAFDPSIFKDCVVRCYEPRCTQSCFEEGKQVDAGCKQEIACLLAMWKNADQLQRSFGYKSMLYNFKVENIVATFCTGYRIDLNLFHRDHKNTSHYDPEDIKCVRYGVKDPDASFSIYDTGAAVVCGTNNTDDLFTVYKNLDLSPYRLDNPYTHVAEFSKRTRDQSQLVVINLDNNNSSNTTTKTRTNTVLPYLPPL
jgi:TATA-box binding protein (TBP) (component of TFIID and TFIIIB)